MRISQFLAKTIRDIPKDAELVSHRFLLRGGYMKQYAAGIYALLPLGLRSLSKIERICREEMQRIDAQEIKMPCSAPKELWEESGRYQTFGKDMMRFQDRHEKGMVLNPTHEEPIVNIVRSEVTSYRQLPLTLFQIQTKFRDEPRPRGGLIRLREFVMKDAYSFHESEKDFEQYYIRAHEAYTRFFTRCGCRNFVSVSSDNGVFGGKFSHEFQLLAPSGEDKLLRCQGCGYFANEEVAQSRIVPRITAIEAKKEIEKIATPHVKTIQKLSEFLGIEEQGLAKAVHFQNLAGDTLVVAFVRGDRNVVEAKVRTLVGFEIVPATNALILKNHAVPGFTGPMGLDLKTTRVLIDQSLINDHDLVVGANEMDHHIKNFSMTFDFLDKLDQKFREDVTIGDLTQVQDGDLCSQCLTGVLKVTRGIEIGNIFHLGTKYTKSMDCTFLDQQGKKNYPFMGCYGIGMTRLLPAIIEESHDEKGPVFPIPVAPFELHLCALFDKSGMVKEAADQIYSDLKDSGVDVVYDDRGEKAGSQFADADLYGTPLRLIMSPKTLQENTVEFTYRDNRDSPVRIPLDAVTSFVKEKIAVEYEKYVPGPITPIRIS